MVDRFRVSTLLARKLSELGVPPANVLRQARLPAGLFEQEKITVSTEELFARYLGIAAVSARTLRDALEPNETAYLLGYEDSHSFFRAFHTWEGSPPGEWRARHAAAS